MDQEFSLEQVRAVAKRGPTDAGKLLSRARDGDMLAFSDWVTWALYKHLRRLGINDEEAVKNTHVLVQLCDIKLEAVKMGVPKGGRRAA